MKKILFNFISYAVALVILIVLFRFFLKPQQLQILFDFSALQISIAVFLSLFAYIGNGVEYYFICKKWGFTLDKRDIALLPLGMNLSGTLIPFQGAMAYQLFFFKKKYDIAVSRSCSVTLFLYLLSMVFSGIAGVAIGFCENTSWLFLLISLLFALSPICVFIAERILEKVSLKISFLEKIRAFFLSTVSGITSLWADAKLIWLLIVIYLLRLLSMILLFAWVANCLNIKVTFLSLLLLNLWNMLSLLIKITPNNIGISQIVSGILFAMIGFSVDQGMLLSLTVNMVFILVALTLGTVAILWNLWDISKINIAKGTKHVSDSDFR